VIARPGAPRSLFRRFVDSSLNAPLMFALGDRCTVSKNALELMSGGGDFTEKKKARVPKEDNRAGACLQYHGTWRRAGPYDCNRITDRKADDATLPMRSDHRT
jgi:hypothetical protein